MQRMRGVKRLTDRHGKVRKYWRATGASLPADIPEDHPRFIQAVAEAMKGDVREGPRKITPGTIPDLIRTIKADAVWKGASVGYRAPTEKRMDDIASKYPTSLVSVLRSRHVRTDLKAFEAGAYNNRLKVWRKLREYAIATGMTEIDFTSGIKNVPVSTDGHHTWTLDEIAAFRAHWEIGTKQRLAFELIYWTGARCVDTRTFGRQMVDAEGWLHYTQQKTGGEVSVPLTTLPAGTPELGADHGYLMDCLRRHNDMTFITTQAGKPRSQKGLSQWVSEMASKAGLPPECAAHGLRKARACRLAEYGWSASRIGAWTGHQSLAEIERYIRKLDKRATIERGNIRPISG